MEVESSNDEKRVDVLFNKKEHRHLLFLPE